jgi:hypothetical protein
LGATAHDLTPQKKTGDTLGCRPPIFLDLT